MSKLRVHDRQPAALLLLASSGVLLAAGYRSLLITTHAKLTRAATIQTTAPAPLILDDRWQAVGPATYATHVQRQAAGQWAYTAGSAYLLLIPGIDVTPFVISQAQAAPYYHGRSQPVLIAGKRYNGIYLPNTVVRLIAMQAPAGGASVMTYGAATRIPLSWASNLHGQAVVSLPPLTNALVNQTITVQDADTGQIVATLELTAADIHVDTNTYTLTPAGKQKITAKLASTGIDYTLAAEPIGTFTKAEPPTVSDNSKGQVGRQAPADQPQISSSAQQATAPIPAPPTIAKQSPPPRQQPQPQQPAPAASARLHSSAIAPVHFGTVTVRYLDKHNGRVLATEQFTGVVGQAIPFDTATIVSKYLPQHYVVSQDDTLTATIFTPGHTTLTVILKRVLPATAKPHLQPAPRQPRAKSKSRRFTQPPVVLNQPLVITADDAREPGGDPATAATLARYFQALAGTINLAK